MPPGGPYAPAAPAWDGHVHVTPDGRWFGTGLDASEERLLREMDGARLEGALVVPALPAADSRFVAGLCRRHPGRLRGLAMPDPRGPLPLVDQARQAVEEWGLAGFKLHPRAQHLDPNDPVLDPLLTYAGQQGLPVMFCTYLGPCRVPLARLTPLVYDQVARRHPQTTLILAHAGVHRVLDAYFVAKAHPNVHLEISHVFDYLEGTSVVEDLVWVCDRLDRRVIFGSDFPETAIPAYRRKVEGLLAQRPACDRSAVMGGNLTRLLARG